MVPLSVLDLAPIVEGSDASAALRHTLELARHAEKLGFERYWLAEHHNMPGIASAATAVVIGHVAAGTRAIRVGSGGVMLPNHAPLVIAEQFGTLAALFPGRIDLGLGRAPGTDPRTARALRRHLETGPDRFPEDVLELMRYFEPASPTTVVRAVPGAGLDVPVWLLGSSLYSARLSAELGLPFAFASHFAPDALDDALAIYRRAFRPSSRLDAPHVMVATNIVAADDDAEAARLATSGKQAFVRLRRGQLGPLPPPVDDMDAIWTPAERAGVERALAFSIVGGREQIRRGLEAILERTRADEIIVGGQVFDQTARLRSFAIVAEVRDAMRADHAAH